MASTQIECHFVFLNLSIVVSKGYVYVLPMEYQNSIFLIIINNNLIIILFKDLFDLVIPVTGIRNYEKNVFSNVQWSDGC